MTIDDAKFTIGDIDENSPSPSGYAVRIYDVKTNIGAIKVSNIEVTASAEMPYIMVVTAGEGNTRNHTEYAAGEICELPARSATPAA